MALITATYVSTTSFTVANDMTGDFVPGIALYCDCGVDGIKYCFVDYSVYSSPNTTVTLDSNESQALTSNLTGCYFSRVKQKEGTGNIPVQLIWMNRGFRSGMTMSYKDADEVYIDAGAVHIDNGTAENIYRSASQITKQLTSLSVSTMYYLYVKPPTNGLSITATEIEYTSTAPTYSQAKRGYYHPTSTTWRHIPGWVVRSNASSNILPFTIAGNTYRFSDSVVSLYEGGTPGAVWTDVTSLMALNWCIPIVSVIVLYTNASALLKARANGMAGDGIYIGYVSSTSTSSFAEYAVPVDTSGIFEIGFNTGTTNAVSIRQQGFLFP